MRMKVGASTIGSFKLYSFQFRLLTAMKLIKTPGCPVLEDSGHLYLVSENDWDALINREDLESVLTEVMGRASVLKEFDQQRETLAPIGRQEVWAARVTCLRSRTARSRNRSCPEATISTIVSTARLVLNSSLKQLPLASPARDKRFASGAIPSGMCRNRSWLWLSTREARLSATQSVTI